MIRKYVLIIKGEKEKNCESDECIGRVMKDIVEILELNPDNFSDVEPVNASIYHYKPPDDTYYTVIEFYEESGQLPDGRSIEPHPLLDNKDEIKKRLEANGYKIIEEYYKE